LTVFRGGLEGAIVRPIVPYIHRSLLSMRTSMKKITVALLAVALALGSLAVAATAAPAPGNLRSPLLTEVQQPTDQTTPQTTSKKQASKKSPAKKQQQQPTTSS
jgi:hypothetical protein